MNLRIGIFLVVLSGAAGLATFAVSENAVTDSTPRIVFDTDMGNDIDDALALLVACQATHKGEAQLVAVCSSNPSPWAVPGIQALLQGLGYSQVPVGACAREVGQGSDGFTRALAEKAGLAAGGGSDSVVLLRKVLADQPDGSVRIVPTGFSTNLAALLETPADFQGDGIPLSGLDLVRQKVEFLCIMAGNYKDPNHGEYNVAQNVPAFRKVIEEWPTPVFMSGYEIGEVVFSRWDRLKQSLSPENIVRFAYSAFFEKQTKNETSWDRPSWDETAMLYAVRPGDAVFDLSQPVRIETTDHGQTRVSDAEKPDHPRRYLKFKPTVPPDQVADLLQEWYTDLP